MFFTKSIRSAVIKRVNKKIEAAQKDYEYFVKQVDKNTEEAIKVIKNDAEIEKNERFSSLVDMIID